MPGKIVPLRPYNIHNISILHHYPPLLGVIHAPQLVVCNNAKQKPDLFLPSQPAQPVATSTVAQDYSTVLLLQLVIPHIRGLRV
jgi:hypothetical protein